jgi:hypothetical protein
MAEKIAHLALNKRIAHSLTQLTKRPYYKYFKIN